MYAGGLTDTFVVIGTAGYMAPEQVTSKAIDFRADQFALGAIIYEMITGRRAFKRATAVQTMAAIVDTEPEPIAELAADTPIRARDRHRTVSCQGSGESLRVHAGSGPGPPRDPLRDGRPHLAFQRRAQAGAASPMALAMDGGSGRARSPWRRQPRSSSPIGRGTRSRRRARCSIASTSRRTWIRPSACCRPLSRPDRKIRRLVRGWRRRTCGSSSTPRQDPTLAARAGEEAGVALTLNQSYAPAHVVLAMINYSQGRFDGALGEAQKAVALDAKYSRAWRERAPCPVPARPAGRGREGFPRGRGARSQRLDLAQRPGGAVPQSQSAGCRGRRVRAHAGARSGQHARVQQSGQHVPSAGAVRQGDGDVRAVLVAGQERDRVLQPRHGAVPAGPVRRRGPLVRRRRGPAWRVVRALVQSRRRLLLGARPGACEGGVRNRGQARRAGASRQLPGSIPPAWQNWPPDTRCWRCCQQGRKRRRIEAGRST